MGKIVINIATDFSPNLGGRKKSLGNYSGEQFFEDLLEPQFLEARKNGEQLQVLLDGASPYGSSFVDESFGELARRYGSQEVKGIVVITSTLYGWIVDYIREQLWR